MQINANMGHAASHSCFLFMGFFAFILTRTVEREETKEKGPQDAAVQWKHCPQVYLFIYLQCPPLILAPLVNMSKVKINLHCLFFYLSYKIFTRFQPIIEVKQLKVGGKSHCEINAFTISCWPQLLAPNYCNVLFPAQQLWVFSYNAHNIKDPYLTVDMEHSSGGFAAKKLFFFSFIWP